MTNKPPKKKADKPAAAATKSATAPKAVKPAKSTVIPFAPVAAEAFRAIGQTAPELKTYYNAMETTMSNYKDQYEKMSGDASSAMRSSMESYVRFGTSMMKGSEAIIKACMELAQDSAERNSAALKTLMACRTLNEAAEAQNKMAQASMDEAMSAASKISEMTIKVCTEACEPLNEQMTKAMGKMSA
ncbi:MAG: phasin family protein [Alphaproteobacteria bacterium]|jgi:phasin family protein|nr:phasin family protein [Alphaproteobacteria bacterium]MCB1550911.1 phasin family protein [Alphaproteobacteria bacterium]MCB9985797.1 phasin family protein [Micavibrio sp.]HPQ50813.1 phasin family protein [Alphaproteobacteria bacterium]HRK97570.1 phasin family protein [Alphaproteobacteria bacterium]